AATGPAGPPMTDSGPGPSVAGTVGDAEPPGTGTPVDPGPSETGSRGDAIGLRLALAFAAVALAAIALLAGLTAVFAAADVSSLAGRQRSDLTGAIAAAAGSAWGRSDSWAEASPVPVPGPAARGGADPGVRHQA